MTPPTTVILIGAGGHARVLLDALKLCGVTVVGITDADRAKKGRRVEGVEVLGDDSALERFPPASTQLVNGLGSIEFMDVRKNAFERLRSRGYRFMTVVHPSAVVALDAVLEEGAQIMAGAIVQSGAKIGMDAIVNTGAQVDHDCRIGSHVHLAPGVTLSGDVQIGERSHLGTGAVVVQGVRIGSDCFVAAGAVVIRNVSDGTRVMGVPAKEVGR